MTLRTSFRGAIMAANSVRLAVFIRPRLASTILSGIAVTAATPKLTTTTATLSRAMAGTTRTFSTTGVQAARRMSGPRNPNRGKAADKKIYNFRRYRAKRLPAPLRMGRNRYLRHWTIHRAWLLLRRQETERRRIELLRMEQSMSAALEELRHTAGPGDRPLGHLYRAAISKEGVWGTHSIPIENARLQVDTPPVVAWDHDWKPMHLTPKKY